MSLTPITITGTFVRADGTASQGTVTAVLTETIQNGVEIIEPTPLLGELNTEGKLKNQSQTAFVLYANDDAATKPQGSAYAFTLEIDNAPIHSFEAVVPHTAVEGKVDLSELEPTV